MKHFIGEKKMTKQEKELREMSNSELLDHFDNICSQMTKEINSVRGQTKKTTTDWQITKAELLRRLEG